MIPTPDEIRKSLTCGRSGCECARPRGNVHCPVPAHDDSDPSLSVNRGDKQEVVVNCFGGCSQEEVIGALRARGLWPEPSRGGGVPIPPKISATVQPSPGCTLAAYAEAKRIPEGELRAQGLSQITYQGAPAVRIPYVGPDGEELAVRFRVGLTAEPRFRWKSGARPQLYGLDRIAEAHARGYVVLVEGESDVHVARHHGIPALGVPGASSFREDRDAPHVDGIPAIYLVEEPDRGGAALVDALARSRLRDQVQLVRLDGAKDLAELHVSDPEAFPARWERARGAAVPLTWELLRRARERREQAAREAEALIREPDILACFTADLRRIGVVGEERAAKVIFLAVVSRLFPRPVSPVVKGPSSAGKSFMVEQVLRFFPESAYYALSAMSERSLAYGDEPLRHRMIVLYEAAAMESDLATYLLRSLLSEGRVRYETVEKTKQGLEPRLIEREGPTGLIVTTTAIRLHPENETRLLSVPVSDAAEQTAAVLRAIAGEGGAPLDFTRWHALQDWLAGGETRVMIPYAMALAEQVPPVAVRLRRDFGAVLTLIRAHALLHQASREMDGEGRIVAAIADYAAVRELVADIVADGIGATVSPTVRETVAAVTTLAPQDGDETTVAAVAQVLRLDKSAALRRVRAAIDRGYLRNLEDRRGRPARLVLGDPLPDDVELLPPAEGLHGCADLRGDTPPSPPAADRGNGHRPAAQTNGAGGHLVAEALDLGALPTCRRCESAPADGREGMCVECADAVFDEGVAR